MSIPGFTPGGGGAVVPPEEEEEKSFDEVVGQTVADQRFIEQNTQLPEAPPPPSPSSPVAPGFTEGPVAPAPPPPAPPPPSLADILFQEQNVDLGFEAGMAPPPLPAPGPTSLQDILFQEQNTLLPEFNPVVDYIENRSPLAQEIQEQSSALEEINLGLGAGVDPQQLIGGESGHGITPEQLGVYYEITGAEPVGPLPGLAREIAERNFKLDHIKGTLDAQDPDQFTTRQQVDDYNALVNEYNGILGEKQGLVDQYIKEYQGLIDRYTEVTTTLFGPPQPEVGPSQAELAPPPGGLPPGFSAGATTPGLPPAPGSVASNDGGLIGQFNRLYGPGGVHDTIDRLGGPGEGAVGAVHEPGATPAIDRELYTLIRRGLVSSGTLADAGQGISFKLSEAGKEARRIALEQQAQRREARQRVELGATTQDIIEFRDDPGFQEFASQLTTLDAPPELLEQLGVSRIAALENPYGGGKPVPIDTNLLAMQVAQQLGPPTSFLEDLGTIALAPLAAAEAGITALPGGEPLLNAVNVPAHEIARGVYSAGRTLLDPLLGTTTMALDEIRGDGGEQPRAIDFGSYNEFAFGDRRDSYDNLPWYVQLPGEVILDPLNLIGVGEVKNLVKVLRVANAGTGLNRARGIVPIVVRDAAQGATRADAAYLRAADQLSNMPMSRIDTFKYADAQVRFSQTARGTFKSIPKQEADMFGSRVSARLNTSDPAQWQDILNEEVGRLAQRTGRVIDPQITGRFNTQLREQEAFSKLTGSEFWQRMGQDFPTVMQATPQWRRAREKALPDPAAIFTTQPLDQVPLDRLVAVGYGPEIAMSERWRDLVEISREGRLIPRVNRGSFEIDYLFPAMANATAGREVSDAMQAVLEAMARKKNTTIEARPTTLDDWRREFERVINEYDGKTLPGRTTADQVVSHPLYQTLLSRSAGQLSQGQAGSLALTDLPVRADQLATLHETSIIHGRNLFDDLMQAGRYPSPPASQRRYHDIIDNLPATEFQRQQIRRLSEMRGKPVSDAALQRLRWDDAKRLILDLKSRKAKSVKDVALNYRGDDPTIYLGTREQLAKAEYGALVADLLSPVNQGRYAFSRPKIRPNGTTANGWLRLSEREIINLFKTAPQKIRALPHYGPAVDEVSEIARRMAQVVEGGNQTVRQLYPKLLDDARALIDSLIDDATQAADVAETKLFHDWLVSQYDQSSLPAPSRPRDPTRFRPDNPEIVHFQIASSEIAARQAVREAALEQLARLEAVADLTRHTVNGQERRLDFQALSRMDPKKAADEINRFFNDRHSPITRPGFFDLIRQANFIGPGVRAPQQVRDILSSYRDLRSTVTNMTREIGQWEDAARRISNQLGAGDLGDLANLSPMPNIQRFARQFEGRLPEYGGKITVPLTSPEARRLALTDSSYEIAFAAQKPRRQAFHYTPPVMEPQLIDDAPRYLTRGAWQQTPELEQALQDAFRRFDATPANTLSASEFVARLTPPGTVVEDDFASQALVLHRLTREQMAKQAGVSLAEARRMRQEINAAFRQFDIHPNRATKDAQALGRAMDIAGQVVDIEAARRTRIPTAHAPGSVEDAPRVRVSGGKVVIPQPLVKPLLGWLEDQARLHAVRQIGPGRATRFAAQFTREVLGPVLDYMLFGVTSGSPEATRVMGLFGSDGARFIRPSHQRPLVPVFDPLTVHLGALQWRLHGTAFDRIMNLFYDNDEVWGQMARRFTPSGQAELTKMSKGVKIGDLTSLISHIVYGNAYRQAARSRENIADIYSEILNQMDEIVDGGPSASLLYGPMFDNSEEMGLWLTWARATGPDGTRNWERVKESWGDLIPHMSLARLPKGLADIFGIKVSRGKLNRAPVLEDLKVIDDWINGKLTLDLDESEALEADLWRRIIAPRWEQEIRPQFRDAISGADGKAIHLDDLDAALFPEDALDPFDAQRFADNLGNEAARVEYERLGYDPDKVPALMKATHYIKRTFGLFWLRLAPRYIINNVFGNMTSIALNQIRGGRGRGVRVVRRVDDALADKTSSVQLHRVLGQGIAGTEFGPGAAQGAAARRVSRAGREAVEKAGPFSFIKNNPVARGVQGYLDFNSRMTDLFEIDARKRVWTVEFDHQYRNHWGQGLGRIGGLDPGMREQMAGMLEGSDLVKLLDENQIPDEIRQLVYRAHNDALAQAHLRAYHVTREVMRDYLMRTRFDNLMDTIFPYSFWTNKNLLFVTGTALDRPATILHGAAIYDAWQEQWEGLPFSARNKLGLFKTPGFLPFGMGGRDIWIRPNNITNPAFFIVPAVVDEMRDAWDRYEDTSLFERLARTTAGGVKSAWEELGYSPGLHWDLVATQSERLAQSERISDSDYAFWSDLISRGMVGLLRPNGFEFDVLPLGGLEDAVLWRAGGVEIPETPLSKSMTIRSAYAHLNQLVRGTPYTRYEMTQMGLTLAEMAEAGELGTPEEAEEAFDRVFQLVLNGDTDALEQDPVGKKLLDRRDKSNGGRALVNYLTAASFTEYTNAWRKSFEANEQYRGIYEQQGPGLGPDAANQWAFGSFNRETGAREGGNAPWLAFFWAANDSPEEFERKLRQKRRWEQEDRRVENIKLAIASDREERAAYKSAAQPYWDQIDLIYGDESAKLNRLYARNLPENVEMRLEDQIMDETRKQIGQVYDAADKEGVSLKGFGNPPRQTRRWYELEERFGEDLRALYQRTGLEDQLPELLSLDDAVALHKVKDQIEAHTEWTMKHVIEVLDLSPYLPGGEVNPRFMTDGRFDQEKWERELQASKDRILSVYQATVNRYRGEMLATVTGQERDQFFIDLLARPISFSDFATFARETVLPKQSAYDLAFSAQLDKVFSLPNDTPSQREARDAAIEEGVRVFGPRFGQVARGQQVKVDMDEVATALTNFYAGLVGEERDLFEEQWGHLIADGGDVRAFDPKSLTYKDAVQIATQYGIAIPTYAEEYRRSRGRQAIWDTWGQLSNEQKSEWKENFATDEYPGFIVTKTGFDEETGEPYSYETINPDALEPEQVREIIENMGIPLDPYLPEMNETSGTAYPRDPKFRDMLADAAFQKETEVYKDQVFTGELYFGDDPEKLARWQRYWDYTRDNKALYDAAQAFRKTRDLSWKELGETLDETPLAELSESGMSMKEFVEGLLFLQEDTGVFDLFDEANAFWETEFGQSVFARDPDFFSDFIGSGGGSTGQSSGGTGGGGRGSGRGFGTGRSRGFSGGSGRRPTRPQGVSYSRYVEDIFRLDTAMATGEAPDAQARYDVSLQVADLVQQRLDMLALVFGENSDIVRLFAQGYKQAIARVLTENPTLELWMQVLRLFGVEPEPEAEPSPQLAEQPEFEDLATSEDESVEDLALALPQ